MQSIVVPVDGSLHSKHALKYVMKIIKDGVHAEVHVINILPDIPPIGDLTMMDISYLEENQQQQSEQIMKSAYKLLSTAGFSYKSKIIRGPIALSIIKYARNHGCSGIVMGTRGMGTLGNLVLGSTANQVVHLAKIPITLVK